MKPSVAISATGGSRSSTMALVTRVVPWTRSEIASIPTPTAASEAAIAATGLSGRLGTLAVRTSPLSAFMATTSVKVPPISIPTCQTRFITLATFLG